MKLLISITTMMTKSMKMSSRDDDADGENDDVPINLMMMVVVTTMVVMLDMMTMNLIVLFLPALSMSPLCAIVRAAAYVHASVDPSGAHLKN